MNSLTTETVSADGRSARQDQNRDAQARWRKRRRHGLRRLPALLSSKQIDALEERGYLDPDRRGDRADETEAIEMFLRDSLTKSR